MSNRLSAVLLTLLLAFGPPVAAREYPPAPPLEIAEWINGDGVTLENLRGKVVVLDFFQMWCPGCNSFSIPLMAQWEEHFAEEVAAGKLVLLSIHTVFEGHDYQSPERLRPYLKKKGIHHLVGVDRHRGDDAIPETMKRFQTRGTPEIAILDKQGRIRFQHFGGFAVDGATALIEKLLGEPSG